MGGPEAETPVVESPVEPLNEEVVRVDPKKAIEKMSNGEAPPIPDANGNIVDQPVANGDGASNGEEVQDGNAEPGSDAGDKQTKTVLSVVTKLKEDTKLSDRWVIVPEKSRRDEVIQECSSVDKRI